MEIKYFNRHKNAIEVEKVYGAKAVEWLYNSQSGKFLSNIISHPLISWGYGLMQDSFWSQGKVAPFIRDFSIPIEEYLPEEGRDEEDPYSSFNNFFIRRFREGAREFSNDPKVMPAFSEARYFGYSSLKDEDKVPVKGKFLGAKNLLSKTKWEDTFHEGPLLLARLCPVDYHRYHYPDDGDVLDYYRVPGALHSVNPLALKKKEDIFITNERQVTILETKNFGKLAYVEVGATCVGKIIQSGDLKSFSRGDEKGYFLFGGSTVIVIGEKGKWAPSEDILKYTEEGIETYIQLGDEVAKSLV